MTELTPDCCLSERDVPSPGPSRRATARSLALALLWAAPTAGASFGAGSPTPPAGGELPGRAPIQDDDPDDESQESPFGLDPKSFRDGVSKAERTEKLLVSFWQGIDDVDTKQLKRNIFGDPEVARWLEANAVTILVDIEVHKNDARANRIGYAQTPCVDIVDPLRGIRYDRLFTGATSTDFLAAVLGRVTDEPIKKPEGDDAKEPFRWLAWANQRFQMGDADAGQDAAEAYMWCLTSAEAFRPGFRARYLDYIVRRLLQNKGRHPESGAMVEQEYVTLYRRAWSGKASRAELYELTRFAEWLQEPNGMRDLFVELSKREGPSKNVRRELLDWTVPVLGRHKDYAFIVDSLGDDPTDYVFRRIAAYERALAKERAALNLDAADAPSTEGASDENTASEESSPHASTPASESSEAGDEKGDPEFDRTVHMIPDDRRNIVEDTTWIIEALLAEGHQDAARSIFERLAEAFPGPRVYGLTAERALRSGDLDFTAEVLDIGLATVPKKSQRKLVRVQNDLAKELAKR